MMHKEALLGAGQNESGNTSDKDTKNIHGLSLVDDLIKDVESNKKPSLFVVKSANAFIDESKTRDRPESLYGEYWYTNEISILFSDSNIGKSILAVQLANDIAQSKSVLLMDFELSPKQFEGRYSNDYTNHYIFPDNLMRAEIDPECDYDGHLSFEDYLIESLEEMIIQTGIRIIIIDNITYLKNETDKAKHALPLMKQLKKLQRKYGLSILVLAHTPKRDMTKPITQNDLGGSKMIMNFCDSAFAIGASQKDPSLRYLKQIKTREVEMKYGSENVQLFQIVKPDNYLFMEFMAFGSEREHLKVISEKDREGMKLKVKELTGQGWSQRQIAKELDIAASTVNKYLKP